MYFKRILIDNFAEKVVNCICFSSVKMQSLFFELHVVRIEGVVDDSLDLFAEKVDLDKFWAGQEERISEYNHIAATTDK